MKPSLNAQLNEWLAAVHGDDPEYDHGAADDLLVALLEDGYKESPDYGRISRFLAEYKSMQKWFA